MRHRSKRGKEAIERRETALAGSSLPKSRLNRKTGANRREKQRRFASKAGEPKNVRKKQKHHRSSSYYDDRRARDKEWAEKNEEKPDTWKDRFPRMNKRR